MESDALATAGKLGLAVLLGGLIGLERESHHRPAGFRTHMIVCLGSCLFMLVSLRMAELDPRTADPGRIAGQVVTGIGFLGAGTILRTGLSVKGLTTAAGLWTAAAIGLAVGAGFWTAAGVATGLTLAAIFLIRPLEATLFGGRTRRRIGLRARDAPGLAARIEEAVRQAGGEIRELGLQRDAPGETVDVRVTARFRGEDGAEEAARRLRELPEVEKAELD